ncbi:unknown [Firmicutes bacterium CAG:631]|nr:unknown [Firmicutes bacterium CAG:631]
MVIKGVIATIATMPKPPSKTSIPSIKHAPIAKGKIKPAVIGPDATPPESKAIAV